MVGKAALPEHRPVSGSLTNDAILARDLAVWLEDREATAVPDRQMARARLERRTGVPKGIFWAARYRARESIAAWLDRLISARVEVLRSEVHELEGTLAAARSLSRGDLAPEIDAAAAALEDARGRLASILQEARR